MRRTRPRLPARPLVVLPPPRRRRADPVTVLGAMLAVGLLLAAGPGAAAHPTRGTDADMTVADMTVADMTVADMTVADMTVVDVTVTPAVDPLSDGFATLRLDVELRSTDGLPDELWAPMSFADPGTVQALRVAEAGPPRLPGETPPDSLAWDELTRVSGTAHDGVWSAVTEVSPALSGTWRVTAMRDFGDDRWSFVDVSDQDASFELGPQTGPVIAVQPAQAAPLRVVTGRESWTPRARIIDRVTGAGVPGAYADHDIYGYADPPPRGQSLPRADAQGYVVLNSKPVVLSDGEYARNYLLAYASRGSRGFSWESATTLWPQVKWQANQRYAVSGRTVTATGNAWPAPAVYPAANPAVHLQHLVGRTWRTVGTGQVRSNGRYTVAWTAVTSGPQMVRVYKPGGSRGALTSVGSTLSAVTVTTR